MLKFLKNIFSLPENEILEKEVKEHFYGAQEKLLKESKAYLSDNNLNTYLDKLREREQKGLRPPVNNFELEILQRRENTATCIVAAIDYLNKNYPLYQYILFNQIEEFCKNYGLICVEPKDYKGIIPDDIQKCINTFEVLEADKVYYVHNFRNKNINHIADPSFKLLDKKTFFEKKEASQNNEMFFEEFPIQICTRLEDANIPNDYLNKSYYNGEWYHKDYTTLLRDANRKYGYELRERFFPEPIILKPFFKFQTYGFLILGSWFPSDLSTK